MNEKVVAITEIGTEMPKVLIIDDELVKESVNTNAFNKFFEDYDIMIETDSKKAQLHIEEFKPDIVLLDQLMPDVSGLTIAEWMVSEHPEIPIIFTTGQSSHTNECLAYKKFKAFSFIKKPIKFPVLQLIVERALERAPLRDFSRNSSVLIIGDERTSSIDSSGANIQYCSGDSASIERELQKNVGTVIIDSTLENEASIYEQISSQKNPPYIISLQPGKNFRSRQRPMERILGSLRLGAHDFIMKPVNNEVLSERIKALTA